MTWWSITARPLYGQDVETCLNRKEVEDSEILTSWPGVLIVRLRSGTPREVAEEIAECLRSRPGEALDVHISLRDKSGLVNDA